MSEIPSIWRTELWHPLFVHFPIVCFLLGTLAGIVAYIIGKKHVFGSYFKFTMSLLLWCGTVFFWIAFYTGQLAYSIEVRKICDPTVLKDHLLWAYISGIIFSLAAVINIIQTIWPLVTTKFLMPVTVLLMIGGSVCMSYDAHLGASLVYQQATGVYVPSSDCVEFE